MPDPSTDKLFPLRVEAFDQAMLDQDTRRNPMSYPQIAEFQGEVDVPALREAVRIALLRHPLLTAKLGADRRGRLAWENGETLPVKIDTSPEPELRIAPASSRLRINREGGVRIYVRGRGGHTQLTFLFHHAYTDGMGSYRFIGDVLALYAQQVAPTPEGAGLVTLEPSRLITRRDSMAYGPDRNAKRHGWDSLAGGFVRQIFGRASESMACTRVAKSKFAYAPFPGIITHTFDAQQSHAIRKAAERQGVLSNDLILTATFQTVVTWNALKSRRNRHSFRVAIPVDLRAKGDELMPAANCVSLAYLEKAPELCANGRALLDSLRVDSHRMRTEQTGTDYIQLLMQMAVMPGLSRVFAKGAECTAAAIFSNTGDPTRRFTTTFPRKEGKLVVGNLVLENIYGISPLNRLVRLAVAAQTYNRCLTLSFRTDPYRLTLKDSREVAQLFVDHLMQLVAEC